MKTPTTPYCIETQKIVQINRTFLLSKGWKLIEDYPLFEVFKHDTDENLRCSIGLYGEFSITELHWCNKTPERQFVTVNRELTIEDYDNIIKLLKIII